MNVIVLMSTYNGAQFLPQQLDSIIAQEFDGRIEILVRDDCSTDNTLDILKDYARRYDSIRVIEGEGNLGPASSFWSLMEVAPKADFYAFSDQDDVWQKNKIASAVKIINHCSEPSLYFSQTTLVDENLAPLPTEKISPYCTFGESLVANYATGCTFVFNKQLLEVVRRYEPEYLLMHDYWMYRLCLAIGGQVIFDPISHILYRQHGKNVLGLNVGWKKSLNRRFHRVYNKDCERLKTISELYKGYSDELTPEVMSVVKNIVGYKASLKCKLSLIFNPAIRCSSINNSLTTRLAILINSF